MKQLLITIAAVLLVGCGESQQSAPLVEAKPEPPTAKAPDISIHQAVIKGDIEAVKQHLNSGADVEVRGPNGGAPLHFAALGGRKEIAELFLTKGADVNAKDDDGWTPLHHASRPDGKETAELFLAKRADVNAKDNRGRTPLFWAALRGRKEVAGLFLAKGADVNAKDVDGTTPLDVAIKRKLTEAADLLRKHGGKTAEELKAAEPVAKAEESSSSKKLTASEVAEIMAFNIGHWETNGEGMPVGGSKQAIKMRMEVRWKEKAESLEYKYTMNQNGEDVSYFGHEEYDAAKGVFVYRSKWGENPETTSHASYNPATRTSYAQTATTKSGVKAKTVTTTKRVGKDKIHQNLRTFENGKLVYTHDIVSTRIEDNDP